MDKNDLWTAVKSELAKRRQNGSFVLRKDANGGMNLFGAFSNRWRDTDFHANPLNGGEIVTSDAHKEFADWLDKHPQHALELWTWHMWGTARKSRANWWGWTDNNFYMNWPLTDKEAEAIANWTLNNEPGMSFGFYVFDYKWDDGTINKYRAFEASILPKKYAENPFASFELVDSNHSGETNMALSKDKRAALVTLHGEQFVKDLEATDAQMAEALDGAGVESKEKEDAAEGVENVTVAEVAFASEKAVVEALTRVEEAFTAAVKALSDKVDALTTELTAIKAEREAEAKAAAAPASVLAAYMPKSILQTPKKDEAAAEKTAVIPGNSGLARKQPTPTGKRAGAAVRLTDLQGAN